jgi:hypothetical protein
MRKFSVTYKIMALVLIFAFTFQTLESINSHTYKVGVDSYHYHCGCFGCYPAHLAAPCNLNNTHHSFF